MTQMHPQITLSGTSSRDLIDDRLAKRSDDLTADYRAEVAFLFARLDEFDWGEELAERDRQWNGHVAPSIARCHLILGEMTSLIEANACGEIE